MDREYINLLVKEEIILSDKIAFRYRYPDNITHLLYVIIPAFIVKYGSNCKQLIEQTFMDVPIRINDEQDQVFQAYYFSVPESVNKEIKTKKGIVLRNYQNIGLMQLLDNLVHEYNHAINSMKNEIVIDKEIKIRTGISYNVFNTYDLYFKYKTSDITLEEVINTKQTESIINIIKEFAKLNLENTTVVNTLYSINSSVGDSYKSNSYLLESIVCQKLMENKTFISTFEKLRFEGEVSELHDFFDSITGEVGSFSRLTSLLSDMLNVNIKLNKSSLFQHSKLNKLRSLTSEALKIVETFNDNSIYK